MQGSLVWLLDDIVWLGSGNARKEAVARLGRARLAGCRH
jgi:hypothetical protein